MVTFIKDLIASRSIHSLKLEVAWFIGELAFTIASLFYKRACPKIDLTSNQAVIIGVGPSLEEDLRRGLPENASIISVNNFPLHSSFRDLKPSFHIVIDSMYWQDFDRLDDSFAQRVDSFYEQINAVDWRMTLLCPLVGRAGIESRVANPHVSIMEIGSARFEVSSTFSMLSLLLSRCLPPRINVTLSAIVLCMFNGCRRVWLVGNDMNRFKDLQVDQINNETFYSVKYAQDIKEKKSFNKLKHKAPYPVHTRLYRESSVFKWFFVVAFVCRRRGIKVENLTSYSFIDAFDRRSV